MRRADGILGTLMQIRGGRCLADLETELADVVDAVKKTGRKGKVTVTFDVERMEMEGPMQAARVDVLDEVKSSVPKPVHGPTPFFVGKENVLTQMDPSMESLETHANRAQPRESEAQAAPVNTPGA